MWDIFLNLQQSLATWLYGNNAKIDEKNLVSFIRLWITIREPWKKKIVDREFLLNEKKTSEMNRRRWESVY